MAKRVAEDNLSCSEPCAKKSKDMETQMFLMQSTMMNMNNEISQLKESQKEMMELLKTLMGDQSSKGTVSEKVNKPENTNMNPSTSEIGPSSGGTLNNKCVTKNSYKFKNTSMKWTNPLAGLLRGTETSKKLTNDNAAIKDLKEKQIDLEDDLQLGLEKLKKLQKELNMSIDVETSDNTYKSKLNEYKEKCRSSQTGSTINETTNRLANSPLTLNKTKKEKPTDPEDTLENWISYGLPDDPCAVRILLRNIEKYTTWKTVIGNRLGYVNDLTKWIKKKNIEQIKESKMNSFTDQLLKNYETLATGMLKVIEKKPEYYPLDNEKVVVFNFKLWQMMITCYMNLEDAVKEKELPVFDVVRFTSKVLLDIYNRVTDQTVCWRTQKMVYFISGSNREGDASERKKPTKYDRLLARDKFNGDENKLKIKDAIQELVSMVKNEELKSDFLSSFWAFVTEKRVNESIKFEDVYEAVCYHFHTSSDDRKTLCNILDYLLMETNNPASIRFMLKNQVTRKITVDLTKPSDHDTEESVEWLYANFLCRLLVKNKTFWEESEPNGAETYMEASKSVAEFCSLRSGVPANYKNKFLYPLNENEPSNQLFATFVILNKLTFDRENTKKTLYVKCGDDISIVLEKMASKHCEEENSIGLQIIENTKRIMLLLEEENDQS